MTGSAGNGQAMDEGCCCGPAALSLPLAPASAAPPVAAPPAGGGRYPGQLVDIPGGRSHVGTNRPLLADDGEGPVRPVRVAPFRLGRTAVTNAEFAAFVAATGYVTEAERFGWSFVFVHYCDDATDTQGVVGTEWWRRIEGASWQKPRGPRSDLEGLAGHPVVQVSWHDAEAFSRWCGGRLPTEAEWEHAARGGLADPIYPWGDRAPDDSEFFPCNIWQGRFPADDTARDGFSGLAPADAFAPNGYGLYNMSGNCWEWSADRFRVRSLSARAKARNEAAMAEGRRLLKGGSHLCHASYCHRYRIAARSGNTPDSTTGHMGFRVAFSASP